MIDRWSLGARLGGLALVCATGTACTSSGAGDGDGPVYEPCEEAESLLGFEVELEPEYSNVTGQVFDKPNPLPRLVIDEVGDCRLLEALKFECEPGCPTGETCVDGKTCVASASAVDVGTVEIEGLSAEVSMTPGPAKDYRFGGDLPHPAFTPGAHVRLSTDGDEPLVFDVLGVADFELLNDEIPVAADAPVSLRWAAPDVPSGGIHVELDIGHHGGSPARIECEVEDDGELEIPASLVSQLFDYGVAGFPAVIITRSSVASVEVDAGCIEFSAIADPLEMEVSIDGVVSCSRDEDCPAGQTCTAGLLCG